MINETFAYRLFWILIFEHDSSFNSRLAIYLPIKVVLFTIGKGQKDDFDGGRSQIYLTFLTKRYVYGIPGRMAH